MSEISVTPKRSKLVLLWLILSQLITLASLLYWAVAAGLSLMAFDSGESAQAWGIVIGVWAYPILPLGLVIGAWVAYARRNVRLAAILSGLSFSPPLLLMLMGMFVS